MEKYNPVTYIPPHASNAGHKDAQRGVFIEYVGKDSARVLFCDTRTIQLVNISQLVEG